MGYRVAVVGATGNVGREMMMVLAEREFPCDEVAAVASSRSVGTEVEFGDTGKMLKCKNIEHFDFADINGPIGQRTRGTIVPQALYFLNHPFIIGQSQATARRLPPPCRDGRRRRLREHEPLDVTPLADRKSVV